jgi:phosphate-selective porin OprO/OprP
MELGGAVQLVARYGTLDIDSDLFGKGYADATKYTDGADSFTLGVNWYLNDLVRLMFNYIHNEFDDDITVSGEKLDDEDVFLGRIQLIL